MDQGKMGAQNRKSEMDPEIAGASKFAAFEGCKHTALEDVDVNQVGLTHARAVLKAIDQNCDDGREVVSSPGRFGKLFVPRRIFRERETEVSRESKCPDDGYVFPAPECISKALEECRCQTSDNEGSGQDPSASALLQQRDRNRCCEISMPAGMHKPRFPRIKTRRQQKKQNKPKKDETTYSTILKRGELAPPSDTSELCQRTEKFQTFNEMAEQFCFTDECTAMMTHLDLNRSFERMPYTAMFKK